MLRRMKLTDLNREDRLQLLRFICSFAWADLEIAQGERDLVHRMAKEMELSSDDLEAVETWLKYPPNPEDVDPQDIPLEHRQIFLNAALQMVGADGNVDSDELENLQLFEKLLR